MGLNYINISNIFLNTIYYDTYNICKLDSQFNSIEIFQINIK